MNKFREGRNEKHGDTSRVLRVSPSARWCPLSHKLDGREIDFQNLIPIPFKVASLLLHGLYRLNKLGHPLVLHILVINELGTVVKGL